MKYPNIIEYTGCGSVILNEPLRGKIAVTKKNQQKITSLIAELNTLPSANNTTVYRDDHINNWKYYSVFFKFHLNKVIKRPEFLSSFQHIPQGPFNLIIRTAIKSNCINITPAQLASGIQSEINKSVIENEAIFKPGTNFRILDVDNKNQKIYLEEVFDHHDLVFTYENMINDSCLHKIVKIRKTPESLSEMGII
jgi:hypothetical protein